MERKKGQLIEYKMVNYQEKKVRTRTKRRWWRRR